jgi:hypothetical protein
VNSLAGKIAFLIKDLSVSVRMIPALGGGKNDTV